MLKVKKTIYGSIPKNNELTKLIAEIKRAIQKLEEEKNKQNKTINDYEKLIQSIKEEYQKLALQNDLLKKKLKRLEDKQLTTDLINHHRKQKKFFEVEKENDTMIKQPHTVKAVAVPNLNITYRKKEKQRNKQQKNIKDIMTMTMKMIFMTI